MKGGQMNWMRKLALTTALVVGVAGPIHAEEIKFGLLQDFTAVYTFVTGQYNQGQQDYLRLVNEEGGIGGNTFTAIVRDTGNQPQRGIEAYNRAKEEGAILFDFLSTPVSAAILDQAQSDKNVVITPAHGRGDASDGTVFPYVFPMMATYWAQAANLVEYMKQTGGLEGKKIAIVHIDSPFGREPGPILQALSEQEKFEFKAFPYASPGNEQSSAWSEVRRYRPDYVMIWGAGGGQAVSVRTAIQNGIRPEQIHSVIWLAETDAANVGPQMKGVKRFEATASGMDHPIIQRINEKVIAPGKGSGETANVGNSYYNLGVATMAVAVEAARLGAEGGATINGDALKAGFEKIAGYDAEGLMPAITITGADHQGGGAGRVSEWDGEKWVPVSEWHAAYPDLVRKVIEESASHYGK
ncbi:ABC transporter substrate-binding protein [Paracoccus laeviglucosivorans]|uniref:Amino acid/amide ABC transporter substrate-binding protein, HAAT family n=1 Tax=Paracoccus laeviglucosivorans TaxID=1197861 RepID=A0A521AZN5_9RHOB|nr:ABC transporter substrate-binding protein [Paracoccus laeviglucosivorans]SMO40293.1 amino acid/amide ABC transporter substrate-binding protein, HAAT family [Paracoccus laeviglucosivorans]